MGLCWAILLVLLDLTVWGQERSGADQSIELELVSPMDQAMFHPASAGIVFRILASAETEVPAAGIGLTLNGKDVTANLSIATSDEGVFARYSNLETNVQYRAVARVEDINGAEVVTNWVFDTLDEASVVVIEGEHYNFNRGMFVDHPDLSYNESPTNYFNRAAVEGIDIHQVDRDGTHLYRPDDPVAIGVAADSRRPVYQRAEVDDYQVTDMEEGDWLNYTRTIPTGDFQVYARFAGGTESLVWARLDQVTAGSATGVQTLAPLGVFKRPESSAPDQYAYVPLTDALGSPVILHLSGQTTFRITISSDDLWINFLALTPVATSGPMPPAIVRLRPWPNEIAVMPDTALQVEFKNGTERVNPATLRFFFNGQEVTEATLIQTNATGLTIGYRPPQFLALDSTNSARLLWQAQGPSTKVITNDWSFVVIRELITLPSVQAFAPDAGRQRGFALHMVQSAPTPVLPDTLARAEAQLAGLTNNSGELMPLISQSLSSPQLVNYTVQPQDIDQGISRGNFTGDSLVPGLVGTGENMAAEVITYLLLNRGSYRFGINSDVSFRLTSGRNPFAPSQVLASFEGTREAADAQFDFLAEATGIYAFRLVWEHGIGNGSLEWYAIDRATGSYTLINDTTKPNPILAYRQVALNPPPLTIAVGPSNVTAVAGQKATFQVVLTNLNFAPANVFYQWQVDGLDVPNANQATFEISRVELTDHNKRVRCLVMVPGFATLYTGDARLLVVSEQTLYVIRALGSRSLDAFTLVLNKTLDAITAQDGSNYQLDGGLSVAGALLDESGTNVILFTSLQEPGRTYTLHLNGVQDVSGAIMPSNTAVLVTAFGMVPGVALRELYRNVEGASLIDLETSERFLLGQYDQIEPIDKLDAPRNQGDEYGQRIFGYLVPPVTGEYRFLIAAADQAELRLSSSADVNIRVPIARVSAPCGYQEWMVNPTEQISAPIQLRAGGSYYFELLHKAGLGSDHVEVAWIQPGQTRATNIIGSAFLAVTADPDQASIGILQQPEDAAVFEGQPVTFYVIAQGSSEFSTNLLYQWQRNGTNLPATQQSSYTIAAASLRDNLAQFRCRVSLAGKTVTSATAVLRVTGQSAAKLKWVSGAKTITLTWDTPPANPDYSIEQSTNVFPAVWTPVAATTSASNGVSRITLPVSGARGFFRLRR